MSRLRRAVDLDIHLRRDCELAGVGAESMGIRDRRRPAAWVVMGRDVRGRLRAPPTPATCDARLRGSRRACYSRPLRPSATGAFKRVSSWMLPVQFLPVDHRDRAPRSQGPCSGRCASSSRRVRPGILRAPAGFAPSGRPRAHHGRRRSAPHGPSPTRARGGGAGRHRRARRIDPADPPAAAPPFWAKDGAHIEGDRRSAINIIGIALYIVICRGLPRLARQPMSPKRAGNQDFAGRSAVWVVPSTVAAGWPRSRQWLPRMTTRRIQPIGMGASHCIAR